MVPYTAGTWHVCVHHMISYPQICQDTHIYVLYIYIYGKVYPLKTSEKVPHISMFLKKTEPQLAYSEPNPKYPWERGRPHMTMER